MSWPILLQPFIQSATFSLTTFLKASRFSEIQIWLWRLPAKNCPMPPFAKRINSILLVEGTESMEGMWGSHDLYPESFLLSPLTWSPKFTSVTHFPHLFSLISPAGHSTYLISSILTWKGWVVILTVVPLPPSELECPLYSIPSNLPLNVAFSILSNHLFFSLFLKTTSWLEQILFYFISIHMHRIYPRTSQ